MKTIKNFEQKIRGTPDFPCSIYHVDKSHPEFYMPVHWHSENEFVYITNGSLVINVNDTPINMKKGDIIFLNDGTLHSAIPENNLCIYECIVFNNDLIKKINLSSFISDILRNKLAIKTYIDSSIYPEVSHKVKELCDYLLCDNFDILQAYSLILQLYSILNS